MKCKRAITPGFSTACRLHFVGPMHRIALRSLMDDKGRLAVALVAVVIATMLMLLQVGIHAGFGRGASAPIRQIGGDVWVMASDTRLVDHAAVLPPGSDATLRAQSCVTRVRPVIIGWSRYRRLGFAPSSLETIEIIGAEGTDSRAVPWSMQHAGLPSDLDAPGRITVDALDRDIVGPVDPIGAELEVSGKPVRVAAMTRGLRSDFGLHPLVFGSPATARDLVGLRDDEAHFWVADLERPDCAAAVIAAVRRSPMLRAERTQDFVDRTEDEVLHTSGVGTVLAFIAFLGFLVAGVIVGQTLVASLRQHRRELAMLVALGATRRELLAFVGWQAGCIAIAGVGGATALTFAVRPLLADLSVEIVLAPAPVTAGALVMIALCALASAGSVHSVLRLEADEVLR